MAGRVTHVFLVVQGDVEGHEVLAASLSFQWASDELRRLVSAEDDHYRPAAAGELASQEVVLYETYQESADEDSLFGRMFGYFAIEKHPLDMKATW